MATTVFAESRGELRPDIEYGRAGGMSLRMDVHIPEGKGLFPAVIVVHGGAWVSGDRKRNVAPLLEPLSDAGFAWFSISYRLANPSDVTSFGAGIDDVAKAIRYVRMHAAEFKIDPDRIALVGESAGAQLASMAALTAEPDSTVKAVVAFYSPSDLVSLAQSSTMIPAQVRQQINGTPWEQFILTGLRQLSPIEHVRRDMPPFLLIHGTSDTLVPYAQSEMMCKRIKSAGGSCELFPVKGGGHGVLWWESIPELRSAYKTEMVDWLKKQLA